MSPTPEPARYRFGDFTFDTARRELRRDGVIVDMPVRVFECLAHLIQHRHRAVGRDELLQAVFNRTDVSDGQLAQVVLRARRCVGDDGVAQHSIHTVPRYGFRWVAATDKTDDAAAPAAGSATSAPPDIADGSSGPVGSDPSAATAAPAVDGRATPAASAPPVRRRRLRRGAAAVAAAALAIAAVLAWAPWVPAERAAQEALTRASAAGESGATVVLPLELELEGDVTAAWIPLGLMDFVADRLRRSGLSVPPSENTLALLAGGADAGAESERARLRRATGAGTLVSGHVSQAEGGWRVRLEAEGEDGLRSRGEATAAEALDAARLACDRLLATIGRAAPDGGDHALPLAERLQRVKAAILANELETARQILQSAPASQLSEPQLRYRLAQVDYRAGKLDAAERELDALLVGPAAADPLFRSRLLVHRGGARVRRNALALAEVDYDAAVAALAGQAADLEWGAALNGRAIVRANRGREAEALVDFGAARARLHRAGDRLGVARVDANLGALELSRGRPAQALDYLQGALAVFNDAAAMNELQVTLSALSATHLQRLDPAAALVASDRALQLVPRTPDPALRLAVHVDRANALVALGRLHEAGAVLGDPAIAAETAPPYELRRAQGHIALAHAAGDDRRVVALADAALADWPPQPDDPVGRWIRLRRVEAAARADLPRDIGTVGGGVASMSRLAHAIARADAADAGPAFEDALAAAEARGAPAEIVEVATAYVPWLLRRRRLDDATALVGRVAPWAHRCHACAVLQWQLAVASGDVERAQAAERRVRRLGGERPFPEPAAMPR
jgi:DNA-binding winged helix-turn-helix (wHTH) protein/tetratricopeptide (TPR) repeat protein